VPPHYDVRLDVGATSAMIYGYLRDAGLTPDVRTATALCCGVRFDTADLSRHPTELDTEAFHETFRLADRVKLASIQKPDLPRAYYRDLYRSLSRARRYGSTTIGLLGRIENPESVAEMADFFLRMEGCRWSLVGGAFEDHYHLSLRTVGPEAHPMMEHALAGEGSFGGRGPVAGGQVRLETGDWSEIQRLERRLRKRALALVDPAERTGSRGLPLTQAP
jgi:nanoRNase/pAp phosphatase (c-di-AMP/oligoRNAs hydrolase)